MNITNQELERFNSKWIENNGCHLWQSPLDKDGYGVFFFRKFNRRAHRVAYFIHQGDIPTGMVIDHICKNRSCVNISHLRVITVRENSLVNSNGVGAKNALRTHCKNGHKFDLKYGKQRYCSICSNEKSKRLQAKWRRENVIHC